jgi:DNA-binding MarR family transcriptional regulator
MEAVQATSRLRERQAVLLAAHLVVRDEMPPATMRFLVHIFHDFFDFETLSGTDMAKRMDISVPAALAHVHILEEAGYLIRVHYRAWGLNYDKIDSMNRRI